VSLAFGPGAARLAGAAQVLLGWRPGEFWAATPAEMAVALGGVVEAGGEPADRATLGALLAKFPDDGGMR
jgi:uncharacterized phage protein (TIGR02216 family)